MSVEPFVVRTPEKPGPGWLLGPRNKLEVGEVYAFPEREHACLTNVKLRAATVVVTGLEPDGLARAIDKDVYDAEEVPF